MFQIFTDEETDVSFVRFTGPVKGAETQRAVTATALRSGGKVRRILLDYREVTEMDLTESDGAMASFNAQRLRDTGVNVAELRMSWVTDPDNTSVNAMLAQRIQRTAPHRMRVGMDGFDSAERSLDEALQVLGLSSNFVLPY